MCVEALLKSAIRHMQVLAHRTRHKADRLEEGALLFLAICMCLSPQSGCVKKPPVNWLAQKGRTAKGQRAKL